MPKERFGSASFLGVLGSRIAGTEPNAEGVGEKVSAMPIYPTAAGPAGEAEVTSEIGPYPLLAVSSHAMERQPVPEAPTPDDQAHDCGCRDAGQYTESETGHGRQRDENRATKAGAGRLTGIVSPVHLTRR
jgi:hypothetical protein